MSGDGLLKYITLLLLGTYSRATCCRDSSPCGSACGFLYLFCRHRCCCYEGCHEGFPHETSHSPIHEFSGKLLYSHHCYPAGHYECFLAEASLHESVLVQDSRQATLRLDCNLPRRICSANLSYSGVMHCWHRGSEVDLLAVVDDH